MDYDDDKIFPLAEEEDALEFNGDVFPGGVEEDFPDDEDEPLSIGTKLDAEEEVEEIEL